MAKTTEILIPDIGTAGDVEVIEILVAAGDTVAKDDSLITLESDKASMEVPSPFAGVIDSIKVAIGDKVGEGHLIGMINLAEESAEAAPAPAKSEPAPERPIEKPAPVEPPAAKSSVEVSAPVESSASGEVYASPGVRRLARELDLNLAQITGTGRKGRLTKDDLNNHIKMRMASGGGSGLAVAAMPTIDFEKYGEVEVKPLNKIKKLTASNLHRNWVTIPHVTQFDEADITDMESFRQAHKKAAEAEGVKLTPLAFIMKAAVAALRLYPQFNASLSPDGQSLIYKKYFNIGVAVETPNGLVVPVIRNVDQKGVYQLAKELGAISHKAREKGLMPADMAGATFTISSLGGIGGTAFTPIVNAPDVAILGVSKASTKPMYYDKQFEPRLMLPLALSYDHRVIDGAEGARFARKIAASLSNLPTLIL